MLNRLRQFWTRRRQSKGGLVDFCGQLTRLRNASQKAVDACTLIVAVKHCMMFDRIHADFLVKEVLDKHRVESIQLLAKKAQDTAEEALEEWNSLNAA